MDGEYCDLQQAIDAGQYVVELPHWSFCGEQSAATARKDRSIIRNEEIDNNCKMDGAWGREAVKQYPWYGPVASFTTGMFAAQVAAVFTNPIDVVKVGNITNPCRRLFI